MEITPVSPQLVSVKGQEASSAQAPVSRHQDDNQSQSVSQEWQQLNQASKELDQMDNVDHNKIAALQAEMANEGYPIDLELIAEAMLEEHGPQR